MRGQSHFRALESTALPAFAPGAKSVTIWKTAWDGVPSLGGAGSGSRMREDARGNADARRVRRHVLQHHRVRANAGMISDPYVSEQFRAGPHHYVPAQARRTTGATAQCDLLKKEAVGTDVTVGMDHHAIRVRQQQAACDTRIQRNVGARHHAPYAMPQHSEFPREKVPGKFGVPYPLIGADTRKQGS